MLTFFPSTACQCDQIGRLLRVLGDKIFINSSPNAKLTFGLKWKATLFILNYWGYFLGNFWKNLGYFFIQHLVTLQSQLYLHWSVPNFFDLSDEYGEKCVNVLLEGEEAELVFIDHPSSEISVTFCNTKFRNFLNWLWTML